MEKTPSPQLFSSPEKRNVVIALGLVLLTLIVYSPVGRNGFINFDDNHYITQNPHIASGLSWQTVSWALTTFHAANWHPLTWISHAIDYQFFGLNASGHHFVNALLHALNAVLLFLIIQSITGFTWRSLVVAAIFTVHPLNVESVAWAAERKTVLSMFFCLLALWAYSYYVQKPTVRRYSALLALFAMALMSKPQVITFPFLLLLLDYWPLRRLHAATSSSRAISETGTKSLGWLIYEKLPLFALSVASALITLKAQHSGNAVRTIAEYSWPLRIENAIVSYVIYLRDVFQPYHLAPIYPHPTSLFSAWKLVVALVLLIGVTACAVRFRKQAPYLLFGWLWFLGSLFPMIGLVQVGLQARADRYMYEALIGVLIAAVWGVADSVRKLRVPATLVWASCGLIVVAFSAVTFHQIGYWKNSETLWNYTLSVTRDNFMAEDNLAQELATQGRTEEALVHFHHILNLYNWSASDLLAFGAYEQHRGYAADAIQQYRRALAQSNDAKTRAVALSNIGSANLELKSLPEAQANFNSALQADPQNVPALIGSGIVAQKNGNLETAVERYTKAISIHPSDLEYELLARSLKQIGKSDQAAQAHATAQKISPDPQQMMLAVDQLLAP